MDTLLLFLHADGLYINLREISLIQQATILVKSAAMTASWIFAYFAVRELPLSFAGAVRASGPLWTMAGGAVVFGESLTPIQLTAVLASVFAYYVLSVAGKREGISVIHSRPLLMMLVATLLSALTTVYDKYMVQDMRISIFSIQGCSAIQRFVIAAIVFFCAGIGKKSVAISWTWFIPRVGISWVVAGLIYFLAVADPLANVTYFSVFRRASLIVGFILSIIFIGERNIFIKSSVILILVLSTIALLIF